MAKTKRNNDTGPVETADEKHPVQTDLLTYPRLMAKQAIEDDLPEAERLLVKAKQNFPGVVSEGGAEQAQS